MILSKADIQERCINEKLVYPFKENMIKSCSYDFTFGGQYYFYTPEDKENVNVQTLRGNETLKIPADAICYIITEEAVNMPNDLTASISLAFGLIKKGVMLSAQPPFDPGYKGKTVALLHNLSNDVVEIQKGQHVLNIVFEMLTTKVEENDLYNGAYQNLQDLSSYCTEVKCGGVYMLMEDLKKQKADLEKQKKRFENSIPNLITIITVIIGVVTILITLITAKDVFFSSENTQKNVPVSPGDLKSFTIPTNSRNEVVISIDGKSYRINFESNALDEPDSFTQNNGSGE